jgi:hypothetical protein
VIACYFCRLGAGPSIGNWHLCGDGRQRGVAAFPQHRGDGRGEDALAVNSRAPPSCSAPLKRRGHRLVLASSAKPYEVETAWGSSTP